MTRNAHINALDDLFAVPTSYTYNGSSPGVHASSSNNGAGNEVVPIPENPFDLFDNVKPRVSTIEQRREPKQIVSNSQFQSPFDNVKPRVSTIEQRREPKQIAPNSHFQSPRSSRATFDPPQYVELQKANSHESYMSFNNSQREISIQTCLSDDAAGAFPEDFQVDGRVQPARGNTTPQGSLSIGSAASIGNPQFVMPLSCHSKTLRAQSERERVLEMAAKLERDELKQKCSGTRAFLGNPKPRPILEREEQQAVEEPVELEISLQKQDLLKPKAPGGLSIRKLIGNPKTKPNVKKVASQAHVVL